MKLAEPLPPIKFTSNNNTRNNNNNNRLDMSNPPSEIVFDMKNHMKEGSLVLSEKQ